MAFEKQYNVVIVGCGLGGMSAALRFDEKINILMLSKGDFTVSSSSLAQGGVAAVLDKENDSFDLHIEDTLIAGDRQNDYNAVSTLVHEAPDDVMSLLDRGVDFDRDENGELKKTLEGGHSRRRIVHYRDRTGKAIVDGLLKCVKQKKNITLQENATVSFVKRAKSGFRVDIIHDGKHESVFASYLILATGGIGRAYKYTTNPSISTGDGIRIAYELGATIKDLSYVQFHPTAFNSPDGREQFLISEAVRGEGAYLLNNEHKRFMHRYDERLELAPRDVVSRSIILESRRTGSNSFYLDITHKDKEYLFNRFPAISSKCLEMGVDISKDYIPIFPCQHYLMGGIEVDLTSRSTVPRLYAVGECSNTGVHGKNRLASNSLPEAMVFGRHAAEDIMRCMELGFAEVEVSDYSYDYSGAPLPKGTRTQIRDILQRAHFVLPNPRAAVEGLRIAENILKRLKIGHFAVTQDYCEALSLATIAVIILKEVNNR